MENVKVALVHDWLTGQRGGEKVLEVLAEVFPKAPIYTLFHFKGSQREDIERRVIRTSFLQGMPFLRKKYRSYLPLFPLAVEMFDLQDYDLVVSTSHCVAKGVIPRPDALHVSYIHSPMRYAWNLYFSYFSPARLSPFSRFLIPPVVHGLRTWDVASSARVDHFVANSANVARRIERYYRREADIIHPPADTDFYTPDESLPAGDFFLIVSALVPYKRIDLAVEAFNRTGAPLRIVGTGPEYKALKRRARPERRVPGFGGLRGPSAPLPGGESVHPSRRGGFRHRHPRGPGVRDARHRLRQGRLPGDRRPRKDRPSFSKNPRSRASWAPLTNSGPLNVIGPP